MDILNESKPFLALAALLIVCMVSNEHFRSPQNLINITRQVSYTGIVALGMTFVIIAGGIDLSIGSLLALAGVSGIMLMGKIADPAAAVLAAFAVTLGIGILGGAVNGAIITLGKVPSFIATLGTLSIYRSLSLYMADAGTVSSGNDMFRSLGSAAFLGLPLPAWIFFGLAVVFGVVLRQTSLGRHICATGANPKAAEYAAIRTSVIRFITYAIAGFTAGVSAFLFSTRLNSISSTDAGLSYELDAIAAAIIGGTAMNGGRGSIAGTVAGVFILGIISNALDMWGAPVNLQGLVKGSIIIVAVLIQRQRNS
ncbi:MAG TPA: ribose ABC transporter permease [Lentisphaeria bacterium]|nr:ribose ABC transporter permease [Lentisphaeria bacterium]HCG50265.1 ribose ABC transporter permease [Lentisphaeria bacterium]